MENALMHLMPCKLFQLVCRLESANVKIELRDTGTHSKHLVYLQRRRRCFEIKPALSIYFI